MAPVDLKALNTHLQDHSYVGGFVPTKADVDTFQNLKTAPAKDFVHVLRWYNHLKSFTADEKKHWGAGASPLQTGTTTAPPPQKDEDDDVDLFGSDSEDDGEAAKIREERLKAYADKKSKKPALIAKSSIVLDVKPWGDDTDLKKMEELVRKIEMDGLVWGASKLIPIGYGINKLQIMCVVEDEKISIDLLTETIQEYEDYVQSVDIAAFNKI